MWKTKDWSRGQVTYCKGMVKNCSTPLSPILDPQFCPSTLAFILGVSHAPNFFHMAPPWPSFGLNRFSSLVQVHLWSNVVRVCSSFQSVVMANSLVVHIMLKEGSEVSPKLQFSWSSQEQVRIQSTWACFDHISLIRTQNYAPFFFVGFLILQGIFQ